MFVSKNRNSREEKDARKKKKNPQQSWRGIKESHDFM